MNAWCRHLGHSSPWGPVCPVGPQFALGACEAGAAHCQAQRSGFVAAAAVGGCEGGLSDLGFAAAGVGDRLPGLVVDGVDGCFDVGELGRCDRIRRVMAIEGVDHLIREEPRIGAHTQFHVPALRSAPDPAWRLCREPLMTALRRTLTHPPMQDLAAVAARRDQRVIAQHLAMAISRALLGLAADLTHS